MRTTRQRRARAALILAAAIVAGTAHAHEVLYLPEGPVYRGDVLDGRPHGEGRMIWPSGAVYDGGWRHGVRHGAGTRKYAQAYCRISSYLQSMANLGYNPLVAIQIALADRAVENMPK